MKRMLMFTLSNFLSLYQNIPSGDIYSGKTVGHSVFHKNYSDTLLLKEVNTKYNILVIIICNTYVTRMFYIKSFIQELYSNIFKHFTF